MRLMTIQKKDIADTRTRRYTSIQKLHLLKESCLAEGAEWGVEKDRFRCLFFNFYLIAIRMRPRLIMAKNMNIPFPIRSQRTAARCKIPFALRPGLSLDDMMRTKEITNKRQRKEQKNA